jgi:hypothetical protein
MQGDKKIKQKCHLLVYTHGLSYGFICCAVRSDIAVLKMIVF